MLLRTEGKDGGGEMQLRVLGVAVAEGRNEVECYMEEEEELARVMKHQTYGDGDGPQDRD